MKLLTVVDDVFPKFMQDLIDTVDILLRLRRRLARSCHDKSCKLEFHCPATHRECKPHLTAMTAMAWVIAQELRPLANLVCNLQHNVQARGARIGPEFLSRLGSLVTDLTAAQKRAREFDLIAGYHPGQHQRAANAIGKARDTLMDVRLFMGSYEKRAREMHDELRRMKRGDRAI